jgi:hypothetical protein
MDDAQQKAFAVMQRFADSADLIYCKNDDFYVIDDWRVSAIKKKFLSMMMDDATDADLDAMAWSYVRDADHIDNWRRRNAKTGKRLESLKQTIIDMANLGKMDGLSLQFDGQYYIIDPGERCDKLLAIIVELKSLEYSEIQIITGLFGSIYINREYDNIDAWCERFQQIQTP